MNNIRIGCKDLRAGAWPNCNYSQRLLPRTTSEFLPHATIKTRWHVAANIFGIAWIAQENLHAVQHTVVEPSEHDGCCPGFYYSIVTRLAKGSCTTYTVYSILTVNTSTCKIYMDRDTENLPVTSGHKSLPLNKFSHCKTIAKLQ